MGKFVVWNLNEDLEKYQNYINMISDITPYHMGEYLLAESTVEAGEIKIFLYKDGMEFAIYPCVIRKIRQISYMNDFEEELYDAIAPHEYGGILTNTENVELMKELHKNFIAYCKENNIVHHFIRINPYLSYLPEVYAGFNGEIIHSNQQVYIDLSKNKDDIWREYKSNVRRNIRRAESSGLVFELAEKNENNIKIFELMYIKAMDILEARSFLYFNEQYYKQMIGYNGSRLCFVKDDKEKVVAASIILVSDKVVYYHLGCFDRKYSMQRPMNYLIHSLILWSKNEKYSIFHLGGGSKNLLQFKEGFSKTRISYYILNQICDTEKYFQICEFWKKKYSEYGDIVFYPLYRYNE